MPAAVMIVLVLAALTVDLGRVHLGRREVVAAADAAANDAVTAGLDERAYRAGHGYDIDPRRAAQSVRATLHARGLLDRLEHPPSVTITGTTITIRVAVRVDYVFARALPGVDHSTVVSATGSATAIAR
jgi:hypothetical protein